MADFVNLLNPQLLFPIILFAVLYLLIIRPQQKKEKKLTAMRKELARGDEIITIGGIVGKVVSVKDNQVTIETGADSTKMVIMRSAIQEKKAVEQA